MFRISNPRKSRAIVGVIVTFALPLVLFGPSAASADTTGRASTSTTTPCPPPVEGQPVGGNCDAGEGAVEDSFPDSGYKSSDIDIKTSAKSKDSYGTVRLAVPKKLKKGKDTVIYYGVDPTQRSERDTSYTVTSTYVITEGTDRIKDSNTVTFDESLTPGALKSDDHGNSIYKYVLKPGESGYILVTISRNDKSHSTAPSMIIKVKAADKK